MAASQCRQEVLYLQQLLEQLGYEQTEPMRVYEDNKACIKMLENPTNPGASRHIDTRIYFIRQLVRDQVLCLHKVKSTLNVSDALTKSLPAPAFHKHSEYLFGSHVPFEAFFTSVMLTTAQTAMAA